MARGKGKKVIFVIPAFNEAPVIANVINGLKKTLKKSADYRYEILVVDDGSMDNTYIRAKDTGAKVIRHILNSGVGHATATGMLYALKHDFDIMVTLDADGQHTPEDAISGVENLLKDRCDLLIGSRLIDPTGMSLVKRVGNKGLSFITYLLFGVNTTDSQSGLRVFSRKAMESLTWNSNGFEFCSEMLWRAKQRNLKIGEYPIRAVYTNYSKAKGQNNWNAFRIVNALLKRRIVELFGE